MTRRPRYIEHLTLDTGHQRRCWREEVADDVIAMLRPLLEQAACGERVAVPGAVEPAGCTMTGGSTAGALLLTVSGPAYEGRAVHPILPPLVQVGVAPDSRASAELWRAWVGGERDDRTPAPPWCASRLMPGLAVSPGAATWLGDYARCVAWAWIG